MNNNFFAFLIELFIQFHTMGFEMLGELGWQYRFYGLGYVIMNLFLALLSIVLALLVDAFILNGIYCLIRRIWITIKTKEIKYYNVSGIVIDKIYHPARTTNTTVSTGKTIISVPQHHSEQYIVRVNYQDITEDFYNESLYKRINVNDNISLVLIHKLDRKNKIIEATLELPE